jgi:hypothetical protein
LPADADDRHALFDDIRTIITAAGELEAEASRRLEEMQVLFETAAAGNAPVLTEGGEAPGQTTSASIARAQRRVPKAR